MIYQCIHIYDIGYTIINYIVYDSICTIMYIHFKYSSSPCWAGPALRREASCPADQAQVLRRKGAGNGVASGGAAVAGGFPWEFPAG